MEHHSRVIAFTIPSISLKVNGLNSLTRRSTSKGVHHQDDHSKNLLTTAKTEACLSLKRCIIWLERAIGGTMIAQCDRANPWPSALWAVCPEDSFTSSNLHFKTQKLCENLTFILVSIDDFRFGHGTCQFGNYNNCLYPRIRCWHQDNRTPRSLLLPNITVFY